MGFSTLIDILGSTFIGGTILLILFRMNDASVESNYVSSGELITQSNLVEIVNLLEYDLRKLGYCKNLGQIDITQAIIEATDTSIYFKTDIPESGANKFGDGIVDKIKYWVGAPNESAVLGTPNPDDRVFYRQVNNDPPTASILGVTQLRFRYFNTLGTELLARPLTAPTTIITMEINLTVENTAAYGDKNNHDSKDLYSRDRSAFYRQIRLAAPSLSDL